MSQLLLPTKLTIRKIGERGRSCTYGVSYVADLQSAAFATRRTRPIIGKQAGIRTHDLTVLETVVFPIKLPACWLPGLDSNQRQQIQSLLCYHYTTRNY